MTTEAEYYKLIPCDQIVPSPANKRKGRHHNIDELEASIKLRGLIQKPLVRPINDDKFELVAGERRWRACSRFMDKIPVEIRELTDTEAHEITFSENFDREDLTPLEESEFVNVMINDGKTFEEIADRFNRSIQWVARRAKLSNLSPEIRTSLEECTDCGLSLWPAVSLELIARFEHHIQNEISQGFCDDNVPVSYNDLKEYLDMYMMTLSKATWKLDDKELTPSAGSCTECAKRSALQTNLFTEESDTKVVDRCLDRACWKAKHVAFITARESQLRQKNNDLILINGALNTEQLLDENSPLLENAKGQYEVFDCKKSDPEAKQALVVSGVDAGKTKWVKVIGKASSRSKSPLTTEDQLNKFTKRRRVRTLDKLIGMISKESAEPELFIGKLDDETIATMAVVWGCRRYESVADDTDFDTLGDTVKQYRTYVKQRQKQVLYSDLARCVLPGIVDILKSIKETQAVDLDFAEAICGLLKIDYKSIVRDVELEIKEPKSLKDIVASDTAAEQKEPVKRGRKKKKESPLNDPDYEETDDK